MGEKNPGTFTRAKGPRLAITCSEQFECPWCRSDCMGAYSHDEPVTTCPHCGREFLCPDESGDLVCVGLLSPADVKYLRWAEVRRLHDAVPEVRRG